MEGQQSLLGGQESTVALSVPGEDRVGKYQRPGDAAETQRLAALGAKPRTGTARERVLAFIAERGGATDEEVQNGLRMNPSTQRPRRVELVEGGWIEDSGLRRETASKSAAVVWALTDAGKAGLA